MSMTMEQVNAQLVSIARRHADGELDRPGFRQQRRSLICDALGLPIPEVPAEHDAAGPSEDDTMPGGTAVHVPLETSRNSALDPAALRNHRPAAEAPATPAQVEAAEPEETADVPAGTTEKRKTLILVVTIVLFLLAFAGIAGLAWFVLR